MTKLPIVIIGAGPVGLAAAAHLSIKNEPFLILEAGDTVGHNIFTWGHVRLFSPWEYNVDSAAEILLRRSGWQFPTPSELPTGRELIENYLIPLSNLPEIAPYLRLKAKVFSISRKGLDKMKSANRERVPFVLYVDMDEKIERLEARAVIDASGTWQNQNPINSDSIGTNGEVDSQEHIYYGIPDILGSNRERYLSKRIAVVGGGHSAINTLLELAELGGDTEIYWIMRKRSVTEAYGGEEKDALQARGALGSRIHRLVDEGKILVLTPFKIHWVELHNGKVALTGEFDNREHTLLVDEVIANTGSRPDFSFLREVRLSVDSATESVAALAPLIDPNIHSCGTVRPHGEEILRQPEKDFYIAGVKSYGRAPTFLMATGYEQVRSIVSHITGDVEASRKVKLKLPETGVCSINLSPIGTNTSCCGSAC